MSTKHKMGLTLLAGVAIGLAGGTAIHAQQTKPAPGYVVAELEVTDAAGFQKYVQALGPTLAPFNTHTLIRGKPQALEGSAPKSFVVIAFESAERAKAWYDSPAYQAIIPLRLNSAKTTAFIIEGVPPQ